MTKTENTTAPKRSGKRKWIAITAGVVLLGGTAAGIAGQRGHHGMMGWHDGPMSEERVERRIERFIDRAGDRLNMTAEQETALTTIAQGVAGDVLPLRAAMRDTRGEIRALLLSGDTVDRTALEALRTERLADADRISATLMSAMADAADVLTPEQRAQVMERMERRGHRHGSRHGRGHDRGHE